MRTADGLEDILLNAGRVTCGQLAKAMEVREKTGQRLSRCLVSLGYLSETALLEIWERQLGFKRIELIPAQIEHHLSGLIPRTMAELHLVIPVARRAQMLLLAMADPTDTAAIEAVRAAAGIPVEPLLAEEDAILAAINRVYAANPPGHSLPPKLEELPLPEMVNTLISQAIHEQASDIHLEPQERHFRIRLRIDGFLREFALFPRSLHAAVVSRLKLLTDMDIAEKRLPQDGRLKVREAGREVDIRVATLPTILGEKMVLRLLDRQDDLWDLNRLGLSEQVLTQYRSLYQQPYGLILITGPTGSGKTTTLYSTLTLLNQTDRNIITVEDPVEYQLTGISQVQVNLKAGMQFANGLRAILRQDPDVIMVGEIRDMETADIAIRAALTGHLVFSTLHTNDAAGAIVRLLEMGAAPFLVASSVLGAAAQRLVRTICPDCREQYWLPPASPERAYWLRSCQVMAGARLFCLRSNRL